MPATPKRESNRKKTPTKKTGSSTASPDNHVSSVEDTEHLNDDSVSEAKDDNVNIQSDASSKRTTSKQQLVSSSQC